MAVFALVGGRVVGVESPVPRSWKLDVGLQVPRCKQNKVCGACAVEGREAESQNSLCRNGEVWRATGDLERKCVWESWFL